MICIVLKESGKAHFMATMAWTTAVEVGEGTLSIFTLRAGLGFVVRGWEM